MSKTDIIANFHAELDNLLNKVNEYNEIKNNSEYASAKRRLKSFVKSCNEDYMTAKSQLFKDCKNVVETAKNDMDKAKSEELEHLQKYCESEHRYKIEVESMKASIKEDSELSFAREERLAKIKRDANKTIYMNAKNNHDELKARYLKEKNNFKSNYESMRDNLRDSTITNIHDEMPEDVKQTILDTKRKLSILSACINEEIANFENKYKISNSIMVKMLSRITKTPWEIVKTDANSNEYGFALLNKKACDSDKVSIDDINKYKENGDVLMATPYGKLDSNENDTIKSVYIAKCNKDSENHNWIEDYLLYKGIYVEKNKESEMKKASTKQSERVVNAIDSYLRALSNIKK